MSQDEHLNDDPGPEELARRLRELPREAEPARDLWPEIAARIAARELPRTETVPASRRTWRGRALLRTAAALAIFAGGVWVGRATVEPPAEVPGTSRDPLRTAAEVQRTGAQYIAALSSLAAVEGPPLDQGREAALSTLYGAAYELDKLPSEDLSQVLSAVSRTQQRGRSEGSVDGPQTIPF